MARYRTIKPDFWSSAQVVECSTNARLLFVGLWNFADDFGVIPAKRIQIKMQVFPGDPFTIDQIGEWLDELIKSGLLLKFSNNSEEYLYVTGWDKHQRIDKPSKKYPGPFDDGSQNVRGTIEYNSESVRPRKEGNGKEVYGSSGDEPRAGRMDYPPEFDALWQQYPKRNGSDPKKAAFSAYRARVKEGTAPEALAEGVRRYAAWCEATGKIGTETVMQAKRFLGPGKEWESDWAIPPPPLRLPRDSRTLWDIRDALGLRQDYDNGEDACHAEIRQRLAEHPELRPKIDPFLRPVH